MRRLVSLLFSRASLALPTPSACLQRWVIVFVPPQPSSGRKRLWRGAPLRARRIAHARAIWRRLLEALLTGGPWRRSRGGRPDRGRTGAGRGSRTRAAFQPPGSRLSGPEAPGTIVVDTPEKVLFLIEPHGKALRYGIGVGRPASNGRAQADQPQVGMAGLDAAAGNAAAPTRFTPLHGRRAG